MTEYPERIEIEKGETEALSKQIIDINKNKIVFSEFMIHMGNILDEAKKQFTELVSRLEEEKKKQVSSIVQKEKALSFLIKEIIEKYVQEEGRALYFFDGECLKKSNTKSN